MKEYIIDKYTNEVDTLFVFEYDNYIVLDMINIKKEYRGQGIANIIMTNLCRYADSKEKCILLTPEPPETETSISVSRLISFYEKFGFRPNKGNLRDYSMPSYSYKRLPE